MYTLPKEIHREIIGWLEPEEQQVTRLTDRYFAGLIQPRDVNLLEFGAERGILEYCKVGLFRNNLKRDVCEIAAENNHLEVLKWARSQGCTWDKWTCAQAAGNGHLGILQWARFQGCPWNHRTCSAAAKNGHLEVLKWAYFQGCPWDYWNADISACPQHVQDYVIRLRG